MKLTPALDKEYLDIVEKFKGISEDWKKYADGIIPEDKEFAKEIVTFVDKALEYGIQNFDEIDVKAYQEFLGHLEWDFVYGPEERNYLEFDEREGKYSFQETFWELADEEYVLTKEKLQELKQKVEALLKKL